MTGVTPGLTTASGEWDGLDATWRWRRSSSGASWRGRLRQRWWAGAYVRNAPPGGKAYAAPAFPSFQGGERVVQRGRLRLPGYGDDRYGTSSSARGASNGHARATTGMRPGRQLRWCWPRHLPGRRLRGAAAAAVMGVRRPGYGSGSQGNDRATVVATRVPMAGPRRRL